MRTPAVKQLSSHCVLTGTLVILLFSLLFLTGCASKSTTTGEPGQQKEEAYIDLKLSFSLVVPSSWKRLQIPVSSPAFRPNMVRWEIPGAKENDNRMQVWYYPGETAQDALAETLSEALELTQSQLKTVRYPFGSALRLEGENTQRKVLYIASHTPRHTHILAFRIDPAEYARLEPQIENVISSFNSL